MQALRHLQWLKDRIGLVDEEIDDDRGPTVFGGRHFLYSNRDNDDCSRCRPELAYFLHPTDHHGEL